MDGKDPIREFLEERGCPQSIIEEGIPGLLTDWEQFVESVQQGYLLTLDDYLNDLDGRQLLEEILPLAPAAERERYQERIKRADMKMRTLVKPAGKCLWGVEVAEAEGWTPEKNWWYFNQPRKGDPEFLAEIEQV